MNGAGSWQPNDLAVAFRAEIFSITTSSGNEDAPTGLEEVSFLGEEFVVRDQGNAPMRTEARSTRPAGVEESVALIEPG